MTVVSWSYFECVSGRSVRCPYQVKCEVFSKCLLLTIGTQSCEKEEEKKTLTFYIHHQHRNRRSETSITHFCIRKDGQEYACFVLLREKKCLYFYYTTIIVSDDAHFDKRQKGSAFVSFYFFGILNKLTLPESRRTLHQSCRRRS